MWSQELTALAFVPTSDFAEQAPLEANSYDDPAMWFDRPGKATTLARWQPLLAEDDTAPDEAAPDEAAPDQAAPDSGPEDSVADATPSEPPARLDYAVFFLHPTSYLDRSNWNAPLDDADSQRIAQIYVRGMASPFNRAAQIWAPRYRQATFGAFLTTGDDAEAAIDAAYADVRQAFAKFIADVPQDMPIVLAGHSQGALHLIRLMREEIADSPLSDRIVAAYPIGWPISVTQDLPFLPFPACNAADQSACIVSWSSYAEPADPSAVLDSYRASIGFDGAPRGDSPILVLEPVDGPHWRRSSRQRKPWHAGPRRGFERWTLTGRTDPGALRRTWAAANR